LLTSGLANFISSFFTGYPGSISLAMCLILESVGGKSQLYGVFAGMIVLIAMLFLGLNFMFIDIKILNHVFRFKDLILELFLM
jgi:MFS superfamily sulfate permease-like transporter